MSEIATELPRQQPASVVTEGGLVRGLLRRR